MDAISDLPRLHDLDADYSPQYVKLARILRDKIESGEYEQGDILPAADLSAEHKVSVEVTYNALAMLAANRYVSRPRAFKSYRVIWSRDAGSRRSSRLCRQSPRCPTRYLRHDSRMKYVD